MVIFLGLILYGCTGGTEKGSLSELKKSVMDVHDEVMPKYGELRKIEKSLRNKASTLQDSILMEKVMLTADEVKSANENMMAWMRYYDPDFEGTEDEIRDYLKDQKEKIEVVKEDMLNALENGNKILADQ